MVAGGLAGASPHMISATVTAISRLVFEFKGTTILVFSRNRPNGLDQMTSHRKCIRRYSQPY